MSTIATRYKLTFGGQVFATEERSTTIDIGGEDNTPVVDAGGNTHSAGELKPGMIKTTLLPVQGLKLRAIQAMDGETIVAEGNNGNNYIMRNAKCGTAREISGGKVSATFFGDCEEL
jgi:hypothetical protein